MEVNEHTLLGDRYRVTRLLGRGGMGAVYLANDIRFHDATVAVKQTLVARESEDLRKAFQREALLLHHLRHPALPRVTDFFGQEDSEFLVMEFVPGEDLATLVTQRGGPFPAEQVALWADKLLDVLAYLHTRAPPVIHRDIKPQNMKLTPDEEIVLLDFGLAKGAVGLMSETISSVVAGTRYFAPPEQLSGQGTDERSDLYSLAATLYALLSATLPTDASVRSSCQINGQADPLKAVHLLCPSVPEPVSLVIMQALRLRKDERPASAIAMSSALRDALVATMPALTSRLAPVRIQGLGETPPSLHEGLPFVGGTAGAGAADSAPENSPKVSVAEPSAPKQVPRGPNAEHARGASARNSKMIFSIAAGFAALALLAVVVIALILKTREPDSTDRGATANPDAPSSIATPDRTVPSSPELTTLLRCRVEYDDGRPIDGPLPAKTKIRLRIALDVAASVCVLAINPDETASVVLSERNARQWNVSTVGGGPGTEVVLPGRGKQLIVETGRERFVVVAVRPKARVPAALEVEPFTTITVAQASEATNLVARTLREGEVQREGDWWAVRLADTDGSDAGIIAVEIPRL